MTEKEILTLAEAHGFRAALVRPEDVPVDAKFRVYCEQNVCGNYNANYSCPPDCGPAETLRQNILSEKLSEEGRLEDFRKSMGDPEYRKTLFEEFGL